jgi:hypothetical protein
MLFLVKKKLDFNSIMNRITQATLSIKNPGPYSLKERFSRFYIKQLKKTKKNKA